MGKYIEKELGKSGKMGKKQKSGTTGTIKSKEKEYLNTNMGRRGQNTQGDLRILDILRSEMKKRDEKSRSAKNR